MRSAWFAALVVVCVSCTEQPKTEAPPGPKAAAGQPMAARATPVAARSFRFRGTPRPQQIAAEAPMSLTASDGTGLALVSLRAEAVAEAPLAFTELRMVFENPEQRVLEGQFRVTLPVGATVSRFAMKIDESWQEGEVVELQAARRAYEDSLHRKVDPALLEQAPGNEFSARVFPIPARGRKEIILSYSQELASAEEPLRIPLRGLPRLGELSLRVFAGGQLVAEKDQRQVVPVEDFTVPAARLGRGAALRSGTLAAVRVTPPVEVAPDEIESLLVLVDTSASRALGFEDQARMVEALMRGLGEGAGDRPVLVAAFDQGVETIHQGGARGYDAAATARLLARKPLGASNLGAALAWAAKARHDGAPYRRVALVSDGVATAGDLDAEPLRAAAKALKTAGVERLDAVVVGGIRDEDRLASLVTAGLARDGAVIDGGAGVEEIARKLTSRSRSGIEVAVEGAAWWWPRKLDAVQAGDETVIYARVARDRPLRVTLDGKPVALADAGVAPTESPLLERAVARAEIASLMAERDDVAPADRKRRQELERRIVDISTAERVLSPFTALLVLETAEDYARFGIDRKALADILTVRDGNLATLRRSDEMLVIAAPQTARAGKNAGKKPKGEDKRDEGMLGEALDQPEQDESGAPAKVDLPPADPGSAPQEAQEEEKRAEAEPPPPASGEASRADLDDRSADTRPAPTSTPAPEAPRPVTDAMPDRRHAERAGPADDFNGGGRARQQDIERPRVDPYTGKFRDVMRLVRRKKIDDAVAAATAWRAESPGDVMALVALGEALEAGRDVARAARAYGSIIDLFPQRADLRRFAGQRLDRLADDDALALAADTYARAAEQRADHPASHRLLAFALVRQGKNEEAFAALERGLAREYPEGRFRGVTQILREDLGLVAAAWIRADPARRGEIMKRLRKAGGVSENEPSIRFVLYWETDANDVDFHIRDGAGNHAFYSQPELASGGRLYADVTTGYGPECFTIRGARKGRAYPYKLEAHYYARGPMGYGMGKLEVVEHDGRGGLRFEQRPFQIMQDNAFVDLGTVRR
jgi:tetratricopeptide (TPR) repeat protein